MTHITEDYLTEDELNELTSEGIEFVRANQDSTDKDIMNESLKLATSCVDNMLSYNQSLMGRIYSLDSLEELYEDMTKLVEELSDEIYYAMVDARLD